MTHAFTTFLNIVSLGCLSFFLSIVVIMPLPRLIKQHRHRLPAAMRVTLLVVLAFTPVMVLGSTLGLAFATISAQRLYFGELHLHHLGQYHWMSWHSLVIGIFTLLSIRTSWRLVRRMRHHLHFQKNLEMATQSTHAHFFALTAGLLFPTIYISSALKDHLSPKALHVLYHHEEAHRRRRDPLLKLFISLATDFFPPGTAQLINEELNLALEQAADQHVVHSGCSPLDVAQTLIDVTALMRGHRTALQEQCAVGFAESEIRERVYYLMNQPLSFARLNRTRTALALIIMVFSLTQASWYTADVLHHISEQELVEFEVSPFVGNF